MTTIAFAGRHGWSRMQPSDVDLGRLVRAFVWRQAGRTVAAGASRDRQVVAAVRGRFPTAVDTFGQAAILALTRHPGPGTCSWCAAAVLAASSGEPMPTPTPALAALLGAQCGRCRVAFAAVEAAEHERGHVDQLVAAGFRPVAAGRLRTPGQVAAHAAAIRQLEQARLRRGPAATGAIWLAGRGEPPGVTAPSPAGGVPGVDRGAQVAHHRAL